MAKKFYKTTYTFFVLSEEPIPGDLGLKELDYETDQGEYVGSELESKQEEVSQEEMAKLLIEVYSDPTFFQIGEDEDEEKKDDRPIPYSNPDYEPEPGK